MAILSMGDLRTEKELFTFSIPTIYLHHLLKFRLVNSIVYSIRPKINLLTAYPTPKKNIIVMNILDSLSCSRRKPCAVAIHSPSISKPLPKSSACQLAWKHRRATTLRQLKKSLLLCVTEHLTWHCYVGD